MMLNNVNLALRFPRLISQLALNYWIAGGDLNLAVNGKRVNIADFSLLDGKELAGVKIHVQPLRASKATRMSFSGSIKSISIGGQELFIDEIKEDLLPELPLSLRCGPGISLSIPANSLVDKRGNPPSGPVTIELSTVDLMSPAQMPGDYSVRMPNGDIQVMQSYGAGSVEIRANGREYNLRPGTQAELTIPVDSAQLIAGGPLPPTIPILFYDEKQGEWFPEGQANLVGAEYKAKVKHFSTINTDLVKTDQSCVRILSPSLPPTYALEYTIPAPAGGGAAPIVRQVTIDNSTSAEHVIYNLPSHTNIVLVPIRTDNDTPIGTFVVNTGGPQAPASPNLPAGPPYNACSTEVVLEELVIPEEPTSGEFLHGLFSFAATNLDELDPAVPADSALSDALDQATESYYDQIDLRRKRTTLAEFRTTNLFDGTETRVSYANGGDLGFGRDMYCQKTWVDDDGDLIEEAGEYDIACYVTNYGSNETDDAQDAQDALAAGAGAPPVATVAMEYSRVESAPTEPVEFDDPERVVKFYVYKGGDSTPPGEAVTEDGNGDSIPDQLLKAANLDGFGARPIPQLCMVCHGGEYPGGPVSSGAPPFADREDVKLDSVFIPFDTTFYAFPPPPNDEASPAVQAAIKSLNEEIVLATDPGPTITEIITGMYSGPDPAVQFKDFVVSGWDSQPIDRGMYADVVAKTCRMCHASSPFPELLFEASSGFVNLLGSIETRVCTNHVMPHAQVTHNIFWSSVGPHMPAQLQVFGDTFGSAANGWNGQLCGVFTPGGDTPITPYEADIQPIWNAHCTGCHTPGGFGDVLHLTAPSHANLVDHASTQSALDLVEPGSTNQSYLWHKISGSHLAAPANGSGQSMPFGSTLSADDPAAATTVENWINDGASP
jgi:mono/diheme cytochrome c family protein